MSSEIWKLSRDFDAESKRHVEEARAKFRAAVAAEHEKVLASSSMETKWIMSIDGVLSGKIDAIKL